MTRTDGDTSKFQVTAQLTRMLLPALSLVRQAVSPRLYSQKQYEVQDAGIARSSETLRRRAMLASL